MNPEIAGERPYSDGHQSRAHSDPYSHFQGPRRSEWVGDLSGRAGHVS